MTDITRLKWIIAGLVAAAVALMVLAAVILAILAGAMDRSAHQTTTTGSVFIGHPMTADELQGTVSPQGGR